MKKQMTMLQSNLDHVSELLGKYEEMNKICADPVADEATDLNHQCLDAVHQGMARLKEMVFELDGRAQRGSPKQVVWIGVHHHKHGQEYVAFDHEPTREELGAVFDEYREGFDYEYLEARGPVNLLGPMEKEDA